MQSADIVARIIFSRQHNVQKLLRQREKEKFSHRDLTHQKTKMEPEYHDKHDKI